MGSRRNARELALQCLYSIEVTGEDCEACIQAFWAEHPVGPSTRNYATALVRGTLAKVDMIDPLLARYAQNWVLSRMAVVDRTVLRMATYEMLLAGTTPPIVVINEAVDIVKKYSTPESGAFVNGILDRIRKEEMKDAR